MINEQPNGKVNGNFIFGKREEKIKLLTRLFINASI